MKHLKIGNIELENRYILGPMAGVTDLPFRLLCREQGAGLLCMEMVSAKAIYYNNRNTESLLEIHPDERPVSLQLFGSDPKIMSEMAKRIEERPFAILDVNMGCPVPKVVKNGEGSALLEDFPKAAAIVSACKRSGKAVTVKFRIGVKRGEPLAAEFAKLCEDAGADALTVHGRPREAIYAGEPDFAQIAAAKRAVSIPVIANGGIFSRQGAEAMLDKTGADGVMIARAAMTDPYIFAEILGGEEEWDRRAVIEEQIADMLPFYGERFTVVQMRKMTAFYLHGMRGAAKHKARLFTCNSIAALREALDDIFPA